MKLSRRNMQTVSFMLFSLFFGAGNLIFPPFLGQNAGTAAPAAMIGFLVTAVLLPVLGVIVVARFDGLDKLAGHVGKRFSLVLTLLIYLSIGPGLGIPRAASVPFEMAVAPYLPESANVRLFLLLYSLVFFLAALWLCLNPGKLVKRIGNFLTPSLLLLLLFLFVSFLFRGERAFAAPQRAYASAPLLRGFAEGYQTMDTIAALAFGIVIAVNIRARGVEEEGAVVQGTVRAGVVAGGMLLAVYCMLAHIGALSGGALPNPADGAEALTNVVGLLFGTVGSVLLAGIFLIACFNVCVGLISSCGEYFHSICPRLSYRGWAVLFALVSMAISNAGLTQILEVSAPVLSAIYPVAIVLIALSFFQRWLEGRRWVYPAAVLCTGVFSVLFALKGLKVPLDFLDALPLADVGLGWVLPAGVGVVLGLLLSGRKR